MREYVEFFSSIICLCDVVNPGDERFRRWMSQNVVRAVTRNRRKSILQMARCALYVFGDSEDLRVSAEIALR